MRESEYEHLYALKDGATGKWILFYWASSQKHKALFSSRQKAEDAVKNIGRDIEIIEL